MDKKTVNSKNINEYYIKHIQSKLEKLENKKKLLENEIQNEKQELINNKNIFNKLKYKNSLLMDQYESLVRILKLRGSIFQFKNNHYHIKEWDNLYLVKKHEKIFVKTKYDEIVHSFDDEISQVLIELIKDNNYSIVVTRIMNDTIKAQLRIK